MDPLLGALIGVLVCHRLCLKLNGSSVCPGVVIVGRLIR